MSDLVTDFHLLRPLWLLALPGVAALVWLYRRGRDPARTLGRLIAPHLLSHLVVDRVSKRRLRPAVILLVLAVPTSVALSGPSWRKEPSPFAEESAVLMVVLRVAPSMEATDLKPSRLERARNKLHDLLSLRVGARAGLVAYAGSAHLVVPPTADGRLVEQMAAALAADVMPVDGDALTEALHVARAQIERSTGMGSLLVIADGVSGSQRERLPARDTALPIQFLAAAPTAETAVQTGIWEAARALGAPLEMLTPDDADVRGVNEGALTATTAARAEGQRWRDEGWFMVPLITLGVLLWGIRGWSTGGGIPAA